VDSKETVSKSVFLFCFIIKITHFIRTGKKHTTSKKEELVNKKNKVITGSENFVLLFTY